MDNNRTTRFLRDSPFLFFSFLFLYISFFSETAYSLRKCSHPTESKSKSSASPSSSMPLRFCSKSSSSCGCGIACRVFPSTGAAAGVGVFLFEGVLDRWPFLLFLLFPSGRYTRFKSIQDGVELNLGGFFLLSKHALLKHLFSLELLLNCDLALAFLFFLLYAQFFFLQALFVFLSSTSGLLNGFTVRTKS